jgi:hypothetical protein
MRSSKRLTRWLSQSNTVEPKGAVKPETLALSPMLAARPRSHKTSNICVVGDRQADEPRPQVLAQAATPGHKIANALDWLRGFAD